MEQSAGGTSKQQVKGTGDQKSPLSSHKLELNDDVLIEILLRLPLISLHLFKSVSKRWLALITDPNFTSLRTRNPNVDHPSGIFVQRYTPEFAYASLDPRIPINGSPKLTTFRFDQNLVNEIEVLQSCNGLVLCCSRPDKFYVYNPTLNVFKLLPLPHVWEPNRIISDMAMAFDPNVSPYYRVLYPLDDITSPDIPIHIEIYSSETGCWSICVEKFLFESFERFHDVVYWKDAVHWIDYSDEVFHFSLDLEKPRFIEVETPKMLNGKGYRDDKLYECRDCLLLVKTVRPLSLEMNVYEMKSDYSGWSVIYHVDFDHIRTEFGGSIKHLPKRCIVMVRALVLAEGEDDPFFVLEVPGKLIRYNIITNIYYELCEFIPMRPRASKDCSFLFIASLTSV